MTSYDPRVDAYIAKSAAFAQPVLEHLRALLHHTCTEISETIKWGMPSFEYKGLMCGFAAFKQHCTFGFWKAPIMNDPTGAMKGREVTAMGSFGKMTSLKDLPADNVLKSLIKEAMRLNEEGINVPREDRKTAQPKKEITAPDYVVAALKNNADAKKAWDSFPPSHRKEYLTWITEAKTEATRGKRLAQMLEWVGEGKGRNWKYER